MFTNFSQKLNGLFGIDGFPPEAAELIISVLTQCNAPLEHRAEVTTPTTTTTASGASYAVALGTWTRASGNGSYVSCRAASDPIGTLTSVATAFDVYLPRSSQDKDPNVYAGDVVAYEEVSGVKYAVGGSYLDDTIGTVKGLYHTTVPNGWSICNGSGSTPDFVTKFVRGNSSAGGTGGANTHGHTFTGTGGNTGTQALSVTGSTGTQALSVTGSTGTQALTVGASGGTTGTGNAVISDHPEHTHDFHCPCQIDFVGGGGPWASNSEHKETGGVLVSGASTALTHADSGHTHPIGSHTHSISPDPHSHTLSASISPDPHSHTLSASISPDPHSHTFTPAGTIDNGSNVPEYRDLVLIIRIGPSGEIS